MASYDPSDSNFILVVWSRFRRAIFRFIRGLEQPLDEPLHLPGLTDPEHERVIERLLVGIKTVGSNLVSLAITPQLEIQSPISLGGLFAKELMLAAWRAESAGSRDPNYEGWCGIVRGLLRRYVYSDRDTFFATHRILKEIASLNPTQLIPPLAQIEVGASQHLNTGPPGEAANDADQPSGKLKLEDPRAEVQPSGAAESASNDCEVDVPHCQFRLVGEIWHIRYHGEASDYSIKGNKCLAWFARLVAKPNHLLTVADLLGDPEGKIVAEATMGNEREADGTTLTNIRKRLEEIESITQATGGSTALEAEKAMLLEQLGGPRHKLFESRLRVMHSNIACQLRKSRRTKLQKDTPLFAAHLKSCLKLDFPEFGYYPPGNSPVWRF